MTDDREPGCCPRCGSPLDVYGTEPGIRSYWVCSDHGQPVVILPPENVAWAVVEARCGIIDVFDQGGVDVFTDDRSFSDRLCDRLETVYGTVREHNRQRHLSRADRDADGSQSGLEQFEGVP